MLNYQKKITILLVCSLFVLANCSKSVKNCRISPDYEKIGESASENLENLSETELKSAQIQCQYWHINIVMKNCENCGHPEHDGVSKRWEKDENGRKYEIIVCYQNRSEKNNENLEFNEDLFNGA